MLRKFVISILLFALCFSSAYAVILQPPTPSTLPSGGKHKSNSANSSHKTNAPERGTDNAPIFVNILSTPERDKEAADVAKTQKDEASNNRYLLIATCVLAFAAILQWLAMARQAKLLKESVDATKRMIDVERPWIIPVGAMINRPKGHDSDNWKASIEWKNIGRSPAIIEDCSGFIIEKSLLGPQPDYDLPNPIQLRCQHSLGVDRSTFTDEMGPLVVKRGKDYIFYVFYGRLTYKSLDGNIHHSTFAIEVAPYMAAFSTYPHDSYHQYD